MVSVLGVATLLLLVAPKCMSYFSILQDRVADVLIRHQRTNRIDHSIMLCCNGFGSTLSVLRDNA